MLVDPSDDEFLHNWARRNNKKSVYAIQCTKIGEDFKQSRGDDIYSPLIDLRFGVVPQFLKQTKRRDSVSLILANVIKPSVEHDALLLSVPIVSPIEIEGEL
jgi:hypothetical protein